MKKNLLFLLGSLMCLNLNAQWYQQYFDGADTNVYNSIFVQLDTGLSKVWQIGPPQKTIFDSPSSSPNVLITDTIATYPNLASSSVTFSPDISWIWSAWGFMAIQWNQKLDLDQGTDGGLVEFSIDTGNTWQNAFNNPNVYNFYGWQPANYDTLPSGDFCFTGTDTLWRNIWFCFKYEYLDTLDTLQIRFTLRSDNIDQMRDGWMIDNLLVHETMFHTIVEMSKESNFKVFPTISEDGKFRIEWKQPDVGNKIEEIEVIDENGRIIRKLKDFDIETELDLSGLSDGQYHVKIITTTFSETFTVFVRH